MQEMKVTNKNAGFWTLLAQARRYHVMFQRQRLFDVARTGAGMYISYIPKAEAKTSSSTKFTCLDKGCQLEQDAPLIPCILPRSPGDDNTKPPFVMIGVGSPSIPCSEQLSALLSICAAVTMVVRGTKPCLIQIFSLIENCAASAVLKA